MTEQDITVLGPAFAAYLRRFRGGFGQNRTAGHFDTYCRGLLSDLPRKSIEPIALAAGTAIRSVFKGFSEAIRRLRVETQRPGTENRRIPAN